MSGLGISYPPPTENVPIFDSTNFIVDDTPITASSGLKYFLSYPSAQGTETLQDTNVEGILTCDSNLVVNKTNMIMNPNATPPTNYIQFPDGSKQYTASSITSNTQNITSSTQTINTSAGVAFISATDGGCVLDSSSEDGATKSLIGTIATTSTGSLNTWVSTGNADTSIINTIQYIGNNLFIVGGERSLRLYNQSTKVFTSVATLASGEYIQSISAPFTITSQTRIAIGGNFTNIGGSGMNMIALFDTINLVFVQPTQATSGSFLTMTQPVYACAYWDKNKNLYIGGAFTIYPTSTSPYFTCWNFTTNSWDTNWGFSSAPAFRATAPITCIDAFSSSNDGNTNYIWSQLLIGGFGFGSSINMCWASGTGTGTNLCRMKYDGTLLRFGINAPSYDICSIKNLSFGSNQQYAIYGYGMYGIGKFGSGLNNTSTARYTTSGIAPNSNVALASYFSLNPTNSTITPTGYNIFSTSAGGFVNQIYYSTAVYFVGSFTNYNSTGIFIQNPCYFGLQQSQTTPPSANGNMGGALNTNGTTNAITNAIANDGTNTYYGVLIGGYFPKSGYSSIPSSVITTLNLAYAKAPISTTYPYITASFYYQGALYTAYRFSKNGDTINVVWSSANSYWYIINPSIIGTLVS